MKKSILLYLLSLCFLSVAFGQTDGENSDFVEEEYVNYKTAEAPLDRLASYKERRMGTGGYLTIAYSQFRPLDFNPNYDVNDFDTIYGGDSTQMIEFSMEYKLNFLLGSIGFGLGVGYQKLTSDINFVDSYLSVVPIRLEAIYSFDNLFDDPWLVPYGVAGLYTVYYREEQASLATTGTTEAAPYFGGGVSFRVDGFMPEESFNAYRENFQENTFVFVEVRKWMASSNFQDPNFETGFQFGAGARFEF